MYYIFNRDDITTKGAKVGYWGKKKNLEMLQWFVAL